MAKEEAELMRAFICIDPPEELALKISAATAGMSRGIKPVAKAQFHITLFFFDGITRAQASAIAAILSRLSFRGFEVHLGRPGAFNIKHPNVLFIEVESEGLQNLYSKMKPLIEGAGIKVEQRPFQPHLTIGRSRNPSRGTKTEILDFIDEHIEQQFGSFHCFEVRLMKSTLTKEGPIYEQLYSMSLKP